MDTGYSEALQVLVIRYEQFNSCCGCTGQLHGIRTTNIGCVSYDAVALCRILAKSKKLR